LIDATLVLVLFTAHFIGDFPLQTRVPGNLGLRKSSSNAALAQHVTIYTAVVGIAVVGYMSSWWAGVMFLAATWWLHFCTDYVTSRLTRRFWFVDVIEGHLMVNDRRRSNFFDTIGFDQLVHAWCLILAAQVLL
jgi:hypothetical protein